MSARPASRAPARRAPRPTPSPADTGAEPPPAAAPESPKYDFETIDLSSDSTHADVVKLVGTDRRVLELGPATGYMTRTLVERGCTVVGIELDPEMAKRAERHTERMIVGDLDQLDLAAELGDDRFDAIVAADVLEHTRDPLRILGQLRELLTPDGFFVISLPNVAHGSVRLALLSGQFRYRDIGLMDRTHLRFFTRETIEELLDAAELGMATLHRHDLNIDASEVPFDDSAVPAELRAALDRDPEARTYQFVVKAFPMARDGLREVQRRLHEQAQELDAEARERKRLATELDAARTQVARLAELEQALAAIAGREGELRRAVVEAHEQLLRRDADLEALEDELDRERVLAHEQFASARGFLDELEQARLQLEAEREAVRARDDEIHRLRVRLDRILQSPPGKALQRAQSLPGLRQVKQRRSAAYLAELRKRSPQDG